MKTKPTTTKSLICALTDEERRNYGIKLATTLEDMEAVEAEKKRQSDHYKDRIAGMQATADQLRHKVSTGQEWREVECSIIYGQPTPDRKQIVRNDTGEVVSTDWLTEAEKQLALPLDDAGDDEGEQAGDGEVVDVESEHVEQEPIDDGGDDEFGPNWEDSRDSASDPQPGDDDAPPVVVDESRAADPLDGDVPEFLKKKGRKKREPQAAAAPMPENDPEAPAPAADAEPDAGEDY